MKSAAVKALVVEAGERRRDSTARRMTHANAPTSSVGAFFFVHYRAFTHVDSFPR